MTLSVLHISTADNAGGSGRSAYKIHSRLRDYGVRSAMLVRDRTTSDPDVRQINAGWLRAADRLAGAVTDRLGLQYHFVPSTLCLPRHEWYRRAHVVQLYNTHGGYFSHLLLPRMCREKNVVWRLSDMWPFTGHCAYAGACERWQTGCGQCPDLRSYPGLARDTTALLWRQKQRVYARSRLQVVAPSEWILGLARRSPLFQSYPISLIRNGIDTTLFRPLNKLMCREILGIPPDHKAVLFLSHVVADNDRKGAAQFLQAMEALTSDQPNQFVAMVVGDGASRFGLALPCPVWRRDLVRDDELLALIYNAADVLVHPAGVENLPNSVLEAMACELPAVAYDAGGVREVVEHGLTGFLAPQGNLGLLLAGIRAVLADKGATLALGRRCRQRILAQFTVDLQARAFLNLYQENQTVRLAA